MTNSHSSPRRHRRSAALAIAAGVLGGGAIGLVATMPGLTSAAATATTVAPSDDANAEDDVHDGPHGRRGGVDRQADLDEFAAVLGVADGDALKAEFAAGKTPAEIAEANGVDLDTVRDHLRTKMQERLDAAVESGKIDQATADEKLADADEHIESILNGEHRKGGRDGAPGRRGGVDRQADLDEFAAVLGVADGDALKAEFAAGKTPAEIAEANGVDLDTVRDHLRTKMQERLDAAVESGRIDQATADEKLADADEHIESILNGEHRKGGRDGGRRGDDANPATDTGLDV